MMRKSLLFLALTLTCTTGWADSLVTSSPEAEALTPTKRPVSSPAIAFAVIGDFGDDTQPNEGKVASLVKGWGPDFIITTGDNNYPRGEANFIANNITKHYGEYIGNANNKQPNRFFPSLGNHDWDTAGAKAHLDYFDLPGNKRYYQFRRGPVEFFAIDSDTREPDGVQPDSKQAQWLKDALATSSAPWKVVFFHHPPYSSGHHGSTNYMQWPFQRWGASVVLTGHDHSYERVVVQGFPYFVVGLGGARIAAFKKKPEIQGATEDFGFDKMHGAMRVEASDTKMSMRFYTYDKKLIDTYEMTRSPTTSVDKPN
jgi:tartrate-resistant acid phosphatase type 5